MEKSGEVGAARTGRESETLLQPSGRLADERHQVEGGGPSRRGSHSSLVSPPLFTLFAAGTEARRGRPAPLLVRR